MITDFKIKTIDDRGRKTTTAENKGVKVGYSVSQYIPSDTERDIRSMIVKDFQDSSTAQSTPRREFNDLCLVERASKDQAIFNVYQPNDGDPLIGNEATDWHSNAVKPIVRNKVISIAAHATARLIFPKVFAYNEQSEEQVDAATVMRDLIEWSCDQSDYAMTALKSVISALSSPVSIVYTGYQEVYKEIKTEKVNGEWSKAIVKNEDLCGFVDEVISPEEIFIANVYENDIQQQDYVIWRRVQSYSKLKAKYKNYDNFKYVKPTIQTIFDDANKSFYDVYDSSLTDNQCEEVLYWKKDGDYFHIMVNGVLLTEPENPNPRRDKQYPFCWYGYELIGAGKFAYFKSLVNKLAPEEKNINRLYRMIADGTFLSVNPPTVNTGETIITSDVIFPSAVVNLGGGKDAGLSPILPRLDLTAGYNMMAEQERGINQSSENPIVGGSQGKNPTAYEMALREKDRQTMLGLFIQMISSFVKQYTKLRISDILQYLTIADVDKITDNSPLVYKTFYIAEKGTKNKKLSKKLIFDGTMGEMTKDEELEKSYELLEEGENKGEEILKINPELFRNLKFMIKVSPDVMNPISEELERAYMLEEYDRAIQNPYIDQEKATRDFLLGAYPKSSSNPDDYMKKQEEIMPDIPPVKGKETVVQPSENALKSQPAMMKV